VTTVTARLAASHARLSLDDLPPEALTVGRQCTLDWLGCAVAGSTEPLSVILRDELLAPSSEPPPEGLAGGATVIGHGRGAPMLAAALVNGAAGHALDYDDTHTTMSGHPTAPVLPAVLALAEELGSSGAEVLVALVTGIEVECRLSAVLGPEHYERGWHATGTLGVVGAAAACARLLGLDEQRWTHALALAVTQSSGLKASFGTMAKPLHAGRAAADGLLAARLAARGFTGNPAVVEAPQGMAQAASSGPAATDRLDRYEGRWLVTETLFKYHAACYLTHAAIDAAASLRSSVPDPGQVDAIEVTVHPSLLGVCAIAEPTTGLEGKFSLRATTALALLEADTADPGLYTDATVARPDVVALRDKAVIRTDGAHPTTWAAVRLRLVDGRDVAAEADTGRPATDLSQQGQRLRAKFDALAAPILGARAAASIADIVDHLDQHRNLSPLVSALQR
jgi:2-methylcitrate dehydratase PrpD